MSNYTPYPDDLPTAGPARDNTGMFETPVVKTNPDPEKTIASENQEPATFAELTTIGVGGAPDDLVIARSSHELVETAARLWEHDDPWILVGGGSNTIVSDEGFPGTAVLVRYSGIERIPDDRIPEGYARIRVQAGNDWDEFVKWTVAEHLAGVEMLSGIPGLVGAAPIQNIGAYGGELAQTLHSVTVYDRDTDEVVREAASDLELGYRDSVFKQGREAIVLSIDVVLRESELSEPIVFPQLARALDVKLGAQVPLEQVRRSVLDVRAQKGMVLDRNDRDTWSAGSFFMNPIVTERFARNLPADAPRFEIERSAAEAQVTLIEELEQGQDLRITPPTPEPQVKLSAAWLIEHAGIHKGFRLPGSGAAISTKHTLAITNLGAASADDIASLARYVITLVQTEFGIILVPEPNVYGLEI
jgi:UDP-N-acetylmuramate dehydrogenase